jgi:aspartate carbamoyltransferase catalytic subunit
MWVPRELEEIAVHAGTKIRRVFRIEEALEDADVVLALRVQSERLHEPVLSLNDYILLYQLSAERLRHAKADAIVLHPGPLNRGIEITPEVADSAQSCILEQVTNGIAVRMALLFLLMTATDGDAAHPPAEGTLAAESTQMAETKQAQHRRRATDVTEVTEGKEKKDPTHAAR